MTKLLFVCHGNICRSPMAEFVMKGIVKKAGAAASFEISSAATSAEEIGSSVYPPARKKLAEHGIDCSGKTARRLRIEDYDRFDLIIGMDEENRRNMVRLFNGDPKGRVSLLLDYTESTRDVADPWYTRDFQQTWDDIKSGCEALFQKIYYL